MLNQIICAAIIVASLFACVSCANNAVMPTPAPTEVPTSTPIVTEAPTATPNPTDVPSANTKEMGYGEYTFSSGNKAVTRVYADEKSKMRYDILFVFDGSDADNEAKYVAAIIMTEILFVEKLDVDAFSVLGQMSDGKPITMIWERQYASGELKLVNAGFAGLPQSVTEVTEKLSTDDELGAIVLRHAQGLASCVEWGVTQEPTSAPTDFPESSENLYSGTYHFDDSSLAFSFISEIKGTLYCTIYLSLNSKERAELLYAYAAIVSCAYLPQSINGFLVMGSLSNGENIMILQGRNSISHKWELLESNEMPEALTGFTSSLDEREANELLKHMEGIVDCLNLPEDFK